jgi:hypothetical protein
LVDPYNPDDSDAEPLFPDAEYQSGEQARVAAAQARAAYLADLENEFPALQPKVQVDVESSDIDEGKDLWDQVMNGPDPPDPDSSPATEPPAAEPDPTAEPVSAAEAEVQAGVQDEVRDVAEEAKQLQDIPEIRGINPVTPDRLPGWARNSASKDATRSINFVNSFSPSSSPAKPRTLSSAPDFDPGHVGAISSSVAPVDPTLDAHAFPADPETVAETDYAAGLASDYERALSINMNRLGSSGDALFEDAERMINGYIGRTLHHAALQAMPGANYAPEFVRMGTNLHKELSYPITRFWFNNSGRFPTEEDAKLDVDTFLNFVQQSLYNFAARLSAEEGGDVTDGPAELADAAAGVAAQPGGTPGEVLPRGRPIAALPPAPARSVAPPTPPRPAVLPGFISPAPKPSKSDVREDMSVAERAEYEQAMYQMFPDFVPESYQNSDGTLKKGTKQVFNKSSASIAKALTPKVKHILKTFNTNAPEMGKTPLTNVTYGSITSSVIKKLPVIKAVLGEANATADHKETAVAQLVAEQLREDAKTPGTPRTPAKQRLPGASPRSQVLRTPNVITDVNTQLSSVLGKPVDAASEQFLSSMVVAVHKGSKRLVRQVFSVDGTSLKKAPGMLRDAEVYSAMQALVRARPGTTPTATELDAIRAMLRRTPGLYDTMRSATAANDYTNAPLQEELVGLYRSGIKSSIDGFGPTLRTPAMVALADQRNGEGLPLLQASAQAIANTSDPREHKSGDAEEIMMAAASQEEEVGAGHCSSQSVGGS